MEDEKKTEEQEELQVEGVEIISCDETEEAEESRLKKAYGKIKQFVVFRKIRAFKSKKYGAIVWQVFTSLIMLALAAGLGIFLAVGTKNGSPETFGKEYFEYFANGNWFNMYNATDVEKSKFINQKAFARLMTQYIEDGIITDYDVRLDEKEGEYAYLTAEYTIETIPEDSSVEDEEATVEGETSEEAEPQEITKTFDIVLKKQDEKVLMFYSTWKGFVDSYIIENCFIEVPAFATPTFDGIDITDCYAGENQETGNSIYELGRVFKGKHSIELTGENIDNKTVEIEWDENGSNIIINSSDFELKQEYKSVVDEQAINIVVGYYTAALAGDETEGIKSLLVENESAYEHVDEQFKAMLGEINHEDGRTMINMEIAAYNCVIADYEYMSSLTIDFQYVCNYTAKAERSVINGVRKQYVGTNMTSAKIYFSYIDGMWKAIDADVPCVDYTAEYVEAEE